MCKLLFGYKFRVGFPSLGKLGSSLLLAIHLTGQNCVLNKCCWSYYIHTSYSWGYTTCYLVYPSILSPRSTTTAPGCNISAVMTPGRLIVLTRMSAWGVMAFKSVVWFGQPFSHLTILLAFILPPFRDKKAAWWLLKTIWPFQQILVLFLNCHFDHPVWLLGIRVFLKIHL